MATVFRTDWDTEPNPRYDVWTVTNGGEILPGVLTPFIATLYNEIDAKGLRELMKAYPTGKRVSLYKPPVGNFFGITAGRLALNVGFSVAAMSCLDPDIATAMAAQFFQGSDEALRLIVQAPADEVAQALAVATAQRCAKRIKKCVVVERERDLRRGGVHVLPTGTAGTGERPVEGHSGDHEPTGCAQIAGYR
jgi:hypothetical protein